MKYKKLPYRFVIHGMSTGLRHQRGTTLVEWMVSITIGLILLAGLTTLIAQQSSTQAELEKSSRQIENGRYAMQLLNEDIQMAGYYGEFSNVAGIPIPGSLPNPCDVVAANIEAAMVFPVQGYDSPATTSGLLSCIDPLNHAAGTDILVVRRADAATLTIASAASAAGGQVYLQSGLSASGLEFIKKLGTGVDALSTTVFTLNKKDKVTLAPLRKFVVHIYFVSPCSVPVSGNSTCSSAADSGKPIPTLKVMELSPSGASTVMSTVPLVEGIENMQIDYGFDSNNDGAPDIYATDAALAANWATDPAHWGNVMALRVHLLARNNESSAGPPVVKTYNLGLAGSAPISDNTFKRRVFSQLIRVVNPSSRRER
jgi:type IV pilus assembly protein PilW